MDILTRKELADKLKVSAQTIATWETKGLPVIRNGQIVRYDFDDVAVWLKSKEGE